MTDKFRTVFFFLSLRKRANYTRKSRAACTVNIRETDHKRCLNRYRKTIVKYKKEIIIKGEEEEEEEEIRFRGEQRQSFTSLRWDKNVRFRC